LAAVRQQSDGLMTLPDWRCAQSTAVRLLSRGADFSLHYWARGRAHAAFLKDLAQASFSERVHLHFSDETEGQRFNIHQAIGTPAPSAHAYVCGPATFIDDALKAAQHEGWALNNVHVERFTGDVLKDGELFTVVAERSGLIFEVPPGKTILEASVENGIDAQSSCQTGVCGTCLTTVLEGIPDHRDLVQTTDEKASNGTCQ